MVQWISVWDVPQVEKASTCQGQDMFIKMYGSVKKDSKISQTRTNIRILPNKRLDLRNNFLFCFLLQKIRNCAGFHLKREICARFWGRVIHHLFISKRRYRVIWISADKNSIERLCLPLWRGGIFSFCGRFRKITVHCGAACFYQSAAGLQLQ